jgi:hypothetical protein
MPLRPEPWDSTGTAPLLLSDSDDTSGPQFQAVAAWELRGKLPGLDSNQQPSG